MPLLELIFTFGPVLIVCLMIGAPIAAVEFAERYLP